MLTVSANNLCQIQLNDETCINCLWASAGIFSVGQKSIQIFEANDLIALCIFKKFTRGRKNDSFAWNVFFCFFFLLFHQLADDEALIMFLQTSLCLVFPYALDNCMPLSSKSSLALSIHLFLCLLLLLSPLTCTCSAAFGSVTLKINIGQGITSIIKCFCLTH